MVKDCSLLTNKVSQIKNEEACNSLAGCQNREYLNGGTAITVLGVRRRRAIYRPRNFSELGAYTNLDCHTV